MGPPKWAATLLPWTKYACLASEPYPSRVALRIRTKPGGAALGLSASYRLPAPVRIGVRAGGSPRLGTVAGIRDRLRLTTIAMAFGREQRHACSILRLPAEVLRRSPTCYGGVSRARVIARLGIVRVAPWAANCSLPGRIYPHDAQSQLPSPTQAQRLRSGSCSQGLAVPGARRRRSRGDAGRLERRRFMPK